MAGHSKWAQIKRKKAVTDARRGKLWTRLLKEVTVSARIGGGDPDGNARLRTAVADAKAANVPNDNIDRAIKRGTGELEGSQLEEFTYEGYGPGGVAVLIETVTDNKNRTVADLRHLFSKHGGNLGENGCVAWMFTKRGVLALPKEALNEEELIELALEVGADDFDSEEDAHVLRTSPEAFEGAREALADRGLEPVAQELAMEPQTYVELEPASASQMLSLMEALEDHDDVQSVWANFDVDDELLATAG